jgi:hypothetical protein
MEQLQSAPTPMAACSPSALGPVSSPRLPWYCVAVVLCAACMPIGILWDISWHLSIGRDTFWTPAHLMVYFGGALPGFICGWLVLKNTFHPDPIERAATVRLWGFRGSIGGWVVILGSFTMLLAGPFDDWWHNAYGLDVQIISPPHAVLSLGIYFVAIGGLLLVASWRNRSEQWNWLGTLLFLFACGAILTKMTIFITEYIYPNQQHTARFYRIACLHLPFWLVVAARASRFRWAATGTAAVYVIILVTMIWILPLFPAQPKLAPIYNPVTHMVPPPFPLLLILPALGIDLLMRYAGGRGGFWRDTALAAGIAALFLGLLLAAQWPFSRFLLSPAARNWFFAGDAMWGYGDHLNEWRTQFWHTDESPLTIGSIIIAICLAALASRLALGFGNWVGKVRR